MSGKTLNFVRDLVLLSAVFLLLALAWFAFAPEQMVSPLLLFLPPFFFGITYGYHVLISRYKKEAFVNAFLVGTTAKMLLFLILLAVYILNVKQDAIPFSMAFMVFYSGYTVFEVVKLRQSLKQ